ncbi:hypothetical protein ACHMW7_16275 [Aminobacter sp. UC22_36]|uniref:hypothetical protein n=1 Tax=Aminobacter sp. UC22_36 TaxID=3374549 RepID=UPI00375711AB
MGMLDAENANRPDKSSSGGSSKSSGAGSTSNHASEREIDRSTGNRSTTDRSSSASSDRPDRSTSSVSSDRREIDRSLSERPTSDRSTGLNSAGNRSTGAGPMASTNRSTTPTGLSPALGGHAAERGIDRSLGSRATPATPTGGLYTSARATEIKSMADLDQFQRTDLASKARAAENKSMADLAVEKTLARIRAAEAGTTNPYNRLVSGGPVDYVDLSNMTLRQVLDYQKGMIAAGHASTALGAYQIKNSTLKMVTDQLGVGLDQKFTPELQDQLAKGLLQNRANRAAVDGNIDVDRFANELANEWAAFKGSSGSGKYDGDGKNTATVSYDQVRDLASGLVDYGVVSGRPARTGTSTGLPSEVAMLPSSRPSFEEKYLGGSSPNTNTGGLSPKQVADYKDYGLNRSYGPVNPVSRPSASQVAAATPSAPSRSAGSTSTLPGNAPAPSSAPQAPKELSTGQKIVAGGIDILGGMIPGVGNGLTIANAGLKLTGNRTIGERIVGDFASGDGKNGSVLMASNGSDRPERGGSGKSTNADPVVRFEETYLTPPTPFDDGVKRPTPAERWGGVGLG